MSKFNKQKTPAETVREVENATLNYEGGLAYTPESKTKLVKMVATSLVGENKFYVSGESHDEELIKTIHEVASEDPEFVLKLALYTREVLKLRSVPMLLLVELANCNFEPIPYSREYVARTIQRVDELTEIIGYQLNRNVYVPRKTKLPMLIKNGVAKAFNKFDEYQFAKYNRDGMVTLKDALFMTHPKPKDGKQQVLFDKIVNDELEIPETWETYISIHGSNTETWSHIAPKLPIFALVRNLRNLLKNDVPLELYLDKLRNPDIISKSKMLPFRFLSAYIMVQGETANIKTRKVLDALEDAMELSIDNMEHIKGDTAIFVDVSASMGNTISDRSIVTYEHISRLFGAMADKICDTSIIGVFGQEFATVMPSKRSSILAKMNEIRNTGVGHATNAWKGVRWLIDNKVKVDRIIVFSDEQVYDSRGYWSQDTSLQEEIVKYRNSINHDTFLHSIDLAGYETTMVNENDPKSNLIMGWSEKILDFINLYEQGFETMVGAVEKYNIWVE